MTPFASPCVVAHCRQLYVQGMPHYRGEQNPSSADDLARNFLREVRERWPSELLGDTAICTDSCANGDRLADRKKPLMIPLQRLKTIRS